MNQKKSKRKTDASLSLLKLLGEKKKFISTILLFSLSFFLLQSIIIVTDSMIATNQNKRYEQYGEWEYAIDDLDQFNFDEADFLTEGSILHYGTFIIINSKNEMEPKPSLSFGRYDETAIELSRMKLLQGHLPEEKDEIALEMETLRKLGLPYEIGQEIRVKILIPVDAEFSNYDTYDNIAQTFTVCGILQSFSSGWSIGVQQNLMPLPEFIVSEKLGEEFDVIPNIGKIKLVKNTSELENEVWIDTIKKQLEDSGLEVGYSSFFQNEKAYPKQLIAEYDFDRVMEIMLYVGIVISACIILLATLKHIRNQKSALRLFFLMGAAPVRLHSFISWQCLYYFIFALPLGICLAILFASGGISLLNLDLEDNIIISIRFSGILFSSLVGLGSYLFAVLLPILFSGRLRFLQQSKRVHKKRKQMILPKKNQSKKHVKRNLVQIMLRSFLETPIKSFLFILFIGIYLASTTVMFSQANTVYKAYRHQADRPLDFLIHSKAISNERLEELIQSHTIQEIHTMKNANFVLSFEVEPHHTVLAQDHYFLMQKQRFSGTEKSVNTAENELFRNVSAIASTPFWDNVLSSEYGMTPEEMEEFYSGKGAIIFLPDVFQAEDGSSELVEYETGDLPIQLITKATSAIKEGDRMILSHVDLFAEELTRDAKEITISKVKSAYHDSAAFFDLLPYTPFGILISEALLSSYEINFEQEIMQDLAIIGDDTATQESIYEALSEIGTEENLVDYSLLREAALQEMIFKLTSLLFLFVVLTVILVFVSYSIAVLEAERMKEKTHVLLSIGMEESKILRCYLIKGLLHSVFCAAAALLLYVGFCFGEAVWAASTKQYYTVSLIFLNRMRETNWGIMFLVFLLFLPIQIGLSLFPAKKAMKIK